MKLTLIVVLVAVTIAAAIDPADASSDSSAGGVGEWPRPAVHYGPPSRRPIEDTFRMDNGKYGPGNRGLEYQSVPGDAVTAPVSGLVVFAGTVVGRKSVTIRDAAGRLSSLTSLRSITVNVGDLVVRAQRLGSAERGLFFSIREDGEYVDPELLLGVAYRHAVLVPLG